MLRKALWSGLLAGVTGGIALVTRFAASRVWRLATGEDPPTKE
jgi:hypothetical protein